MKTDTFSIGSHTAAHIRSCLHSKHISLKNKKKQICSYRFFQAYIHVLHDYGNLPSQAFFLLDLICWGYFLPRRRLPADREMNDSTKVASLKLH